VEVAGLKLAMVMPAIAVRKARDVDLLKQAARMALHDRRRGPE